MEFRKVTAQDVSETDQLFTSCLNELLAREQIREEGLLENEVCRLQKAVQESFQNSVHPFFVAIKNGEIAGTIALYPPGPMISSVIRTVPGSVEVACVYVHPNFQRQGIGKFLFHNILQELKKLHHSYFFLDAGFPSSQAYWQMILGEPSCVVENYWGAGKHHLIWKRDI